MLMLIPLLWWLTCFHVYFLQQLWHRGKRHYVSALCFHVETWGRNMATSSQVEPLFV